jgi:surface polysaccharide O-acyltransferase-like enzyme
MELFPHTDKTDRCLSKFAMNELKVLTQRPVEYFWFILKSVVVTILLPLLSLKNNENICDLYKSLRGYAGQGMSIFVYAVCNNVINNCLHVKSSDVMVSKRAILVRGRKDP